MPAKRRALGIGDVPGWETVCSDTFQKGLLNGKSVRRLFSRWRGGGPTLRNRQVDRRIGYSFEPILQS